MVREQLDARRLATGLDRGPARDLGEERRDVRRGIGPHKVVGEFEERDDRAVAFARRLAVGDAVAADAELARERGLETLGEGRVALGSAERLGDTDRAADLRPREEAFASDVERDPGRAHRALDGGQLGVRPDEDRDRAVRGAGRRERPDRGGHPGQLRLVGREPADLWRRTGRQARRRGASAAAARSRVLAR